VNGRAEHEFAEFVRATSGSLFRTAYLMTGDHQLAEDLLQTTFTKVYVRWRRIARMDNPVGYARRVLVNQAASWLRRRSSRELPTSLVDTVESETMDLDVVTSATVWSAVLTLPPRQRAVVVLRYYEDMTEPQIADLLAIRVGTVKSTLAAAGRKLAVLLCDLAPLKEEKSS
jgi:RNA polymerase sigma-70 factor (sigma-E family)